MTIKKTFLKQADLDIEIKTELAQTMGEKSGALVKLLTPQETAKILGVSPGTLAVWRSVGTYNLPFIKIGNKPMYLVNDIVEFIARRRRLYSEDAS